MRIMSLDVGSQTIGVAVSDLFGWTAQGVETIRHTTREKDFARLWELTDQYKVEEFVLGLPLNMNGTKGMRFWARWKLQSGAFHILFFPLFVKTSRRSTYMGWSTQLL